MEELNDLQVAKARIEMMQARITGLEEENKNYDKDLEQRDIKIRTMFNRLEEVIKVQKESIHDSYNAGLYNGLVTALYIIQEKETPGNRLCKWNGKEWELSK